MTFNKSVNDAAKLIDSGEVDSALNILTTALKKESEDPQVLNLLGVIYFRFKNDITKAEELFEKAIEINKNFGPTYINYSELLKSESRYVNLTEVLVKALEVTKLNKSRVYYEIGAAFEMQNSYGEASKHYQKAIQFSLNNQEIVTMGKAIQRCGVKSKIFVKNKKLVSHG